METGVIIAAGGIGKRFGNDLPKQFIKINELTILEITLQKFQESEFINSIVLVSHIDYLSEAKKIGHSYTKVKSIISGGEHRQDSVWRGIQELAKYNVDIILIHDAVRPYIKTDLINQVIKATQEFDAAVPAVPTIDTIKLSDNEGFLLKTLDRTQLFAVQTPQGFKKDLITQAYEKAMNENFYSTDDASLVERLGKKIKLVCGDYRNIKITTINDIREIKS